jgi:cytochrome c peroxidase
LLGLSTPQITAASTGNRFSFRGTNGTPGGSYFVLATTNLVAPMSDWQIVATNTFNSAGNFNFSAPINAAAAATFYRLSLALPTTDQMLPLTLARFKTPSLRDLGHSEPYMHTGRMNSLEAVIQFYQNASGQTRLNTLRNAAPELGGIFLDDSTVAPLAAFLRSLNEDYTD